MTAVTRRSLLRELSAHPAPDRPLQVSDPGDDLVLLLFAAAMCKVEPSALTPLDLMAALSNLKGARTG